MAKKVSYPAVAATLGAIVLGAGGVVAWRSLQPATPGLHGLPRVPGLENRPQLLRDMIADAEARVRQRRTALEGVAELGRLYHANGFFAEAEACWQVMRSAEPKEGRWSYLLADLASTAGDPARQEELLKETVARSPDYAPAWLKLADLQFKSGRTEEAATHYQRRLSLLPGDPYARLGLARVARQSGHETEAQQLIEQLVRDVPDFPPGHNLLVELLAHRGDERAVRLHRWLGRETGRYREADDPWLHELAAWCHDPQRLHVLGTLEFQLGRGDRGLGLVERAVRLAPEDPDGYDLLGELQMKLGNPAKARPILEKGLQLAEARPGTPRASLYVNLTDALRLVRQLDEALRVANRGLERAGNLYELHSMKGVVLDDMGRKQEAILAFRTALELNANDTDSHFRLALTLLELERVEEAYNHLRRALVLQPTFPKALTLLAEIELQRGRLDAAWEYLGPLYDANPGQQDVRELVALWHLHSGLAANARGDLAATEKHYREGVAVQPDNADLQISLGGWLLGQSRVHEALAPLETYRRLRPDEAQGFFFLGQANFRLGRRDEARRLLLEGELRAKQAGQATLAAGCRELLSHL